ncbi:A-factor biosynthesis protein [Streptomyces sp. ISL-22]|uniref:ScbA/BarX family gamma-butyrolactone biosynthesis protein n=1 Tax=unclassified Streptomyces TaxID=2593676 RepID=UPI001BE76707|nr:MULTISPECIES: ScbA/BarX family gamma-butyrolactone biosynthesis protein [unclassified Streptomyces]MBT2422733.1 A-factor biosynthesis protein [Streptomyces sp. ISL-24]MBT2435904.1 A-factor biosynthesis protein [Streptomyces sp. ISL-22]
MSHLRQLATTTTPLAKAPTLPGGLTATVPRQLVHRASVAETFLTDWAAIDADRFTVTAQWPRAHQLHVSPDRSAHEPLLVAETVRQAGSLLAHTAYDVPLGHQFVLRELRVTTRPEHLAVGAVPAEPVLHVTVTDLDHRGGRPAGFRYDTDVRIGGELVATASIAAIWTSEPVYRRLRGGRTAATVSALPVPPGLPPAVVDRALPADVVLARSDRPDRWQLRVDTAHAVFFDHPLDHIPGMLLLEAARQAVRALPGNGGRTPVSFRAVFHQYAELDRPTWVEATETADASGTAVQVVGRQEESTVFECEVGTEER